MRAASIVLSLVVVLTALGPSSRTIIDRKTELQIAAQFAPIFQQTLGEVPRADYITNFDFDGDWKGNNNWNNLENTSFPLKAFTYYSVLETSTHYFVHYAVFHPRDYKGGLAATSALNMGIRIALERLGKDPTGGLADDVALSHENDLEGCLVVAAKKGPNFKDATLEYVETMAHNRYLRYRTPAEGSQGSEVIESEGQRPILYIEPKGHGISGKPAAQSGKTRISGQLKYSYAGRADEPSGAESQSEVGYDLISIYDTLWKHAHDDKKNETYGVFSEYAPFALQFIKTVGGGSAAEVKTPKRKLGAAFLGEVGSPNKARPPWGWFDQTERDRPLGEWFFDPASVVARHFELGDTFSRVYLYHPYLGKVEPFRLFSGPSLDQSRQLRARHSD